MTLSVPTDELRVQVDSWLADAVDRLARGELSSFDGCLVDVGEVVRLDGTLADCHVHFVRLDGNGRPRTSLLATKLVDCAIEYCIPRRRIKEAADHYDRTGSSELYMQLQRDAKDLFTTLERSGEAGEMLLFVFLERKLKIPQILSKMSLKTNSQLHFNGCDGIHAKVLHDGKLALYWGESKLYEDVNKAIDACLEGAATYLLDDDQSRTRRDVVLVRDYLNLGDDVLTEAVLQYFMDESPQSAKVEVRAACLIGFSLDEYPNPFDGTEARLRADVRANIENWHDRLKTRINFHRIEKFEMQVFCLPVPSVGEFRRLVRERLGIS